MFEPEPLQQCDRTYVRYRGRKCSYFSGCDYFRLASHPQVVAALHAGARKFGLNVAASRMTTGNHALYGELESQLEKFFGAPAALVVGGGYMTNLAVAQALAGNFSHALIDERAHPALQDAARFLECPILQFPHRDAEGVAAGVSRCGPGARLVLLTDGMFSRDGSAAPLNDYLAVLPKDALLLVDDAHGAGVLGPKGQGTPEYARVNRGRVVQTITLSKAFGVYGGAILGSRALRRRMIERSHLFVGSTPLPLPLAYAAMKAVAVLAKTPSLRQRLTQNARYLKDCLRQVGLTLPDAPGPIVALVPQTDRQASGLRRALLAAGLFPPFIKYPGGPPNGYFRFVLSSEHTRAQLDQVVAAVRKSKICDSLAA